MASKAKSGLTAVRQTWEDWLIPPITFTGGAASYTSSVRDGKGHAAVHIGVTNDTAGVLQVLMAWQAAGPFEQVAAVSTGVDPVSGYAVADITLPMYRRFVKIIFTPTAAPPGLGAHFEVGAYFAPRADSGPSTGAGGSSGGSAVANRSAFQTGQKAVAVPLTAVQLSVASIPIPSGFSVFITFLKANAGANIYLAESSAKAIAHTNCKILNTQNAGIRLYVTDINLIWIDADTAADGVDWIVEK